MAKRARVVIGANYGDEGKGLVTDFLCSKTGPETLVVRHNGGAQAGHTVNTPDKKRHVFGHYGSGSFIGAATYLSRFYVCNPIIFFRECTSLDKSNVNPVVYVDPDAPVTTPYDMMINQMVEDFRAGKRHGSCGTGFGETIERNLNPAYALYYKDLKDIQLLKERLLDIRKNWLPQRLAKLGVTSIDDVWLKRTGSDEIFERYMNEAWNFLEKTSSASIDILKRTDNIVFEGAQGLQLDMDRGAFPHVTRSNTGIKNAVTLAREAGIQNLDVTYITRAYNTRHGAGPFPNELPAPPYKDVRDETNVTHPYQGSLRFSWLDLDQLGVSIKTDMTDAPSSMQIKHKLAVTCMDQVPDIMTFFENGAKQSAVQDDFLKKASKITQASDLYISRGPTRGDVSLFK